MSLVNQNLQQSTDDVGFSDHVENHLTALDVAGQIQHYSYEKVSELLVLRVLAVSEQEFMQFENHKAEHVVLFHQQSHLLNAVLVGSEVQENCGRSVEN